MANWDGNGTKSVATPVKRSNKSKFVWHCCRFKGEIEQQGIIDEEGHPYCIAPLLYETGWILFDVSTDGTNFNRSGEYLSGKIKNLRRFSCTSLLDCGLKNQNVLQVFFLCNYFYNSPLQKITWDLQNFCEILQKYFMFPFLPRHL